MKHKLLIGTGAAFIWTTSQYDTICYIYVHPKADC